MPIPVRGVAPKAAFWRAATAFFMALYIALPLRADVIVTGGGDKKIKVWNVDGTPIRSVDAHDALVNWLAISPDGKTLASAGLDGKVKLWNLADLKLLRTIDAHEGGATAVAFSPTGKLIISSGVDKMVKIWDLDGKLIKSIEAATGKVLGIRTVTVFGMDFIVSAGADGNVKVWSYDGATAYGFVTDHVGGLTYVTGDPIAQLFYTGGADGKIKFWGLSGTGAFDGAQSSPVRAMCVSPDGKLLVTGGEDGKATVWDTAGRKPIQTIDDAHAGGVLIIAVSPDGKSYFSGGNDRKLKIWDATGKLVKAIDAHDGSVKALVYVSQKK